MAAGGHFVQKKKKVAYRSEMARNAIESYLRTSKMAVQRPFCQKFKKLNKVPYGSEMARNAIESELRTSKMAYQSEMARNAIQSDFQTSKMAAGKKNLYRSEMARIAIKSEFRKSKWPIDLKWPEMRSKVNFGHLKWPPAAILSKISKKN